MIRVGMVHQNGTWLVTLVLEPDDLDMLRAGRPALVNLNELVQAPLPFPLQLVLDFTPDVAWVAEQFKRRGPSAEQFERIVIESRARPEVRKRPSHSPQVVYDAGLQSGGDA